MSQQHTTQTSGQGMLERVFKLREHGTTARTEVIAGFTTFLTMVYIVFVNPQILGVAGMDTSAVFVTTCLIAAFGSILMGLFATNFGEGWRRAQGADASAKMLSFFSTLPVALASWWPSLHPLDLLVGLCCCGGLRLAVYLKSKNAKKYRHGMEYGSARWSA